MNDDGTAKKQSNHLLPVATPMRAVEIIGHLAPNLQLQDREWHHVATKNFWRVLASWLFGLVPALIGTQIMAVFVRGTDFWVNSPLYWLAIAVYAVVAVLSSWYDVRFHAFSLDGNSFGVRKGWLSRKWHYAEIRRAHAVSLSQGPADRWFNTATLTMDTPGAGRGVLKMPFLPYQRATELRDAITGELNRSIQS